MSALAVSEKTIQQACKQLLRLRGIAFYDLSQPRATKQTPGLADLLAFVPRGRRPALVWIEVKSQHGRLSDDQRTFARLCEESLVLYWVIRSAAELAELLTALET